MPLPGCSTVAFWILNSMVSQSFSACTLVAPEDTRIVTFGAPDSYAEGVISIQSGTVKSKFYDEIAEEPYYSTSDLIAAMTGGVGALKYKHEVFESNLLVSAGISLGVGGILFKFFRFKC